MLPAIGVSFPGLPLGGGGAGIIIDQKAMHDSQTTKIRLCPISASNYRMCLEYFGSRMGIACEPPLLRAGTIAGVILYPIPDL